MGVCLWKLVRWRLGEGSLMGGPSATEPPGIKVDCRRGSHSGSAFGWMACASRLRKRGHVSREMKWNCQHVCWRIHIMLLVLIRLHVTGSVWFGQALQSHPFLAGFGCWTAVGLRQIWGFGSKAFGNGTPSHPFRRRFLRPLERTHEGVN